MTEQVPAAEPEADATDARPETADTFSAVSDAMDEEPVRTGLPAVDDVLADIERLTGQPLDEHLPAFERAHGSLRAALDAEPDDPA